MVLLNLDDYIITEEFYTDPIMKVFGYGKALLYHRKKKKFTIAQLRGTPGIWYSHYQDICFTANKTRALERV
jgi:hypothetical protein